MKRGWIFWTLLGLLAASGIAFSAWQTHPFGIANAAAAATQTPTIPPSPARQGNPASSVFGSGNLVAAQTVDLGFSTTGNIATLNVQLGDRVKAGQVLAELDGIEQKKVDVQTQQIAVEVAQKALSEYQANTAGSIAQALATQASAQAALATAQAGVHTKGDPRCDTSLREEYYFKYLYAQKNVDFWQGQLDKPKTGYGWQYIMQNLNPAKRTRDLAYDNYVYCQGYTDQEIQASQGNLQKAQVDVKQAENAYQTITSNKGIDPNVLQLDQAQLVNAEAQLAKTQADLQAATLVAPFDGVVTAVNAAVGQSAGRGAVLTLADVSHPLVQVNIDETDLVNFSTGCSAQVTFNALPGKTFPGVVDWIAPSLVTVGNAAAVQGRVSLNTPLAGITLPPLGSTASVTVTCQPAQNGSQAPVQTKNP